MPPDLASLAPSRRASQHSRCVGLILTALLLGQHALAAPIVEQTLHVPTRVQQVGAGEVRQDIVVTVVREDVPGRRPILVLEHGRGVDAAARTAVGVQAYPANARYFASRGFAVLIPTRIGYGVSGGPDVEYTGECAAKRYADGVAAAVAQTRQLLDYAARLPYVDADRGIVLGESFGGLVAVAIAASDLHGVIAVISIAGGDGGDSQRHVDQPCRPDLMADAFARYGQTNRLPTLWLYSANDRLWGRTYPRQWFAAFKSAGGRGEFIELPADKNNGHYIFNRNPPAWQPAVERFMQTQGFLPPGH